MSSGSHLSTGQSLRLRYRYVLKQRFIKAAHVTIKVWSKI